MESPIYLPRYLWNKIIPPPEKMQLTHVKVCLLHVHTTDNIDMLSDFQYPEDRKASTVKPTKSDSDIMFCLK